LNADIVHDGQAYADRRVKHSLENVLDAAEYDARKHERGLWANVKEEQMPGWRREWLKQMHATRPASAGG
jgi:endonuclease YncB( thermonuclease family)